MSNWAEVSRWAYAQLKRAREAAGVVCTPDYWARQSDDGRAVVFTAGEKGRQMEIVCGFDPKNPVVQAGFYKFVVESWGSAAPEYVLEWLA